MGKSASDKRANEAAKKGKTEERSSDEEVMKRRRVEEAYDASDLMLGIFGWALWGVGAVWFVYFGQATMTWLPGDPTLTFFACGWFCTGMSRASPKDTWSPWRLHWQLCWVPAWALLTYALAQVALDPLKAFMEHGWNYAPFSKGTCWVWTAGCAVAALSAAAFHPQEPPRSAKSADSPLAKMLFLADMAFGLLVAAGALFSAPWSKALGPQAAWFTAVPYIMWAIGTGCCRTQSEMLRALPAAVLVHIGAVCRVLMFANGGGFLVLFVSAVMAVSHLALFLPLPLQEPSSNIFYLQRVKLQERCYRMISNPSEGWADDQ